MLMNTIGGNVLDLTLCKLQKHPTSLSERSHKAAKDKRRHHSSLSSDEHVSGGGSIHMNT